MVMRGYRADPARTAEALDEEGWLHTGDLAEVDDDGYVRIVDRKKDIIINASGKNMSPANIESVLKAASPLVGHVVCIGDARPYNVALVVPDSEALAGRPASDPDVHSEIASAIDRANADLARVEQIKTFTVVDAEWLPRRSGVDADDEAPASADHGEVCRQDRAVVRPVRSPPDGCSALVLSR